MLHSSDEKVGKRAKTNDGLYFVELRNDDSNGSNLLYLDYATRQAIVVCEKPDCLHNDETCTAFFPYRYGAANSCVVGNYLYIIFSGSEKENILPALYRIDLNGQNRTQLATLPSEFDYNNPVATDGEKLYTVCNRIEAEENGASVLLQTLSPFPCRTAPCKPCGNGTVTHTCGAPRAARFL